ncbi:MAG: ASKHA domain-containing protein [Planctomycetota bacterium]
MTDSAGGMCKVRFLPDDVQVEIPRGETILAAAQKAKVYINSICGGDGICGKCKVIVQRGEISSEPTALLTREEVQKNYVLACMAKIESDLHVLVPEETRVEGGKILLDEDGERFGALVSVTREDLFFRHDPLIKKVYLELAPPTMQDPTADHERVYEAIRRIEGNIEMQTGYQILRRMPTILRENDWKITATIARRRSIAEMVQIEAGDTSQRNFGVAVDIGTTTVVAYLVDLETSQAIDSHAKYNSQARFGEDYIKRIMYAAQNNAFDVMQQTIVDDINELIQAFVEEKKVHIGDITAIVCAGNTAMIHFLLGLDSTRIRCEPYIPTANFVPPIRAAEVGIRINYRGLLYCLPSVAAYVGSDITAGAAAIRLDQAEQTCLFIDIGTNGEVVLGNKDWMICCSASAGPAFEGQGVTHGMRAAAGAIEALRILPGDEVEYQTIGNRKPKGLCGSGLLDCIAEMLCAGVIDRSGAISSESSSRRVRQRDGVWEYLIVPRKDSGTDSDIVITQHDIEHLIRSKAAVYAALAVQLESINMSVDQINQVYLAGGFGNYLNVRNAIRIGMLPDIPTEHIRFVGNTAATGAKMALLSNEAFETIEKIARQMTYLDLMGNNRFMEEFVSASFLPHTKIEQFPSVERELMACTRGERL